MIENPVNIMLIPAVLIAIVLHEMAHGYAALWQGDPTAKSQKRLSFNPLRHIDPFGALLLLLVGFGWAKPVSVDMRYFKNPKRGMAYCALAGPVMNFLVAFFALLVLSITARLDPIGYYLFPSTFLQWWIAFWQFLAAINVGLGFFNLIPIPPLDGSKILFSLLPNSLYYKILQYERYGMFLLMILLVSGVLLQPLQTATENILTFLLWPAEQIASLLPQASL